MASENHKVPEEQQAKEQQHKKKKPSKPPEINPYVFPFLLAAFGLWCFYDGCLTSDPDMQKHSLFNQVVSAILLPWAVYDFLKVRKYERKHKKDAPPAEDEDSAADENSA